MSKIGVEARQIGAQGEKSGGNRKNAYAPILVGGEVMGDPRATPGPPPRSVEHFFGTRKIENVNLRSSRAELSSGTHITHPIVRVPGANGTDARGRRARVRVIFTILRFRE